MWLKRKEKKLFTVQNNLTVRKTSIWLKEPQRVLENWAANCFFPFGLAPNSLPIDPPRSNQIQIWEERKYFLNKRKNR